MTETVSNSKAKHQLQLLQKMRRCPQVLMVEDTLPIDMPQSIYFVPTLSDSLVTHSHPWHLTAMEMLLDYSYQGLILVPENRKPVNGRNRYRINWHKEALSKATQVVFNFYRHQPEHEAQQLYFQLGMATTQSTNVATKQILICAPDGRITCPFIRFSLATENISIYSSLSSLLRAAART